MARFFSRSTVYTSGSGRKLSTPGRSPWGARRRLLRYRRLIATLLLCAAAGVFVEAALPEDAETTGIVTAIRDLPVGAILTDAELTILDVPVAATPAGAYTDTAAVLGQRLATPLLAGAAVAQTSLVGPTLLTGAPEGSVAVPLRPADPSTVQLLSAGQLVDVVLSTGNGFESSTENTTLAQGLPVLWVSESGDNAWPGSAAQAGLVVVAAPPQDAAALAGSSSSGTVHLILTSDG